MRTDGYILKVIHFRAPKNTHDNQDYYTGYLHPSQAPSGNLAGLYLQGYHNKPMGAAVISGARSTKLCNPGIHTPQS